MGNWPEAYLHWLEAQIGSNKHRTYYDLCQLMHAQEFIWLVPNDDNRLHDGLDLRAEFIHDRRARIANIMEFGPCSILEVLIGLSRRLAFMTDGTPEGWAWQLLINLDLEKMSDPLTPRKARKVSEQMEALIWRTYNPDGSGGFFPLAWPEKDMTKVELWYQMAAYVNEMHPDY